MNRQAIKKVVEPVDRLTEGTLVRKNYYVDDDKMSYCVVGLMLHSCGVSDEQMLNTENEAKAGDADITMVDRMAAKIFSDYTRCLVDRYEVTTPREVADLFCINDGDAPEGLEWDEVDKFYALSTKERVLWFLSRKEAAE